MAINNFVKRIQDVMRNDSGVNGDAQRIEQIVWLLFLKIYDAKEEIKDGKKNKTIKAFKCYPDGKVIPFDMKEDDKHKLLR